MSRSALLTPILVSLLLVACEGQVTEPGSLSATDAPHLKKKDGGGKPGGGGGGPANPVIAFYVNGAALGKSELRVINADGSNSTVVVPGVWLGASPAWSPLGDGTTKPYQIAYSSGTCGPLATVGITTPDGGGVVASEPTIIDATRDEELTCSGSPAWSPDGNKIAFQANSRVICLENGNEVTQFTFNLFTMNPDGSDLTRYTHNCNDTRAWGPSWSPDGKAIAFRETGNGGEAIKILHLDDMDGSPIETVFDKAEIPEISGLRRGPDWGRDDNNPKLAFTAVRSNSKGNRNRVGVYTLALQKDPITSHYSRAPGSMAVVLEVDGSDPSWSPDDARFVMNGLAIYDVNAGEETSVLGRGGMFADWRR